MRFENPDSEVERAQHCPECRGIIIHLLDCSRSAETTVECALPRYDYSHLVGDPLLEHGQAFDATRFDELLTADDRLLLRFGMHIAW